MIEVEVARVVIYNNDLIVLLRAPGAKKVLPIHVDAGQAHSIELKLENVDFPRPLTHDLLKSIIDMLDCKLERAEICDLVDGTFFAKLMLGCDGKIREIDARPSDAIALALRTESPIFVDEDVMAKAGVMIKLEKPKDDKPKLTRMEALEMKLQKAIDAERYEDAARIRDEIIKLEEHKTTSN